MNQTMKASTASFREVRVEPAPPPVPADLPRSIGFWGGTAILVGNVIGSGIFRTPAGIAAQLDDPGVILALWGIFGIVCLCGTLTLAELASLLPKSGGLYVYMRKAYGEPSSFVYGWFSLVQIPSGFAAVAIFFGDVVVGLATGDPKSVSPHVPQAVAVGTIALLGLANIIGVRLGTFIQKCFTSVKVAALLGLIGATFLFGKGSWEHLEGGSGTTLAGLATATAAILWSYDGWSSVGHVAGEVKTPERNLKGLIVLGTLCIIVLYAGANLAYLYMMPLHEMAREKVVAQGVMSRIAGPAGAGAVAVAIACSLFGSLNGAILARARVTYAMARDGLTFRFLGQVHPRFQTPWASIVAIQVVTILLLLWMPDFDSLLKYMVFVGSLSLIFGLGSVFVLRRKMAHAVRPFRVPLYPWVPLVFILGTLSGVVAFAGGQIQKSDFRPFIGLGIVLLGFPVYAVWNRFRRRASE